MSLANSDEISGKDKTCNAKVALVVTAKNESGDIGVCLKSLQAQSFESEVILVDNGSTDKTPEIAEKLGVRVAQKGPERSAQRNHGFAIAKADFVCFLDADMIAPTDMVRECLGIMKDLEVGAVVIPEESFGDGFWTQCKILERSCYPPGAIVEAARFYRAEAFQELNGFDETLTGLEDLDLHQRCAGKFKIAHSATPIRHHEGTIAFFEQLKKKFYYGSNSWSYARKHPKAFRRQGNPFRIYFFRNWRRLARTPLLTLAMLFMKTCELLAGGGGVFMGMIKAGKN